MYFDTLLKTSAPDKQPNSHISSLIFTLFLLFFYKKKDSCRVPMGRAVAKGIRWVKDLTQLSLEGFQYSS